jgi:hypothetical protein
MIRPMHKSHDSELSTLTPAFLHAPNLNNRRTLTIENDKNGGFQCEIYDEVD